MDVCCWMKSYLYLAVDQTLTDGGIYSDPGVGLERSHYEESVYRFQAMAIADFSTYVHTVALSGLTQTLTPLEKHKDTLIDYVNGGRLTTRDLATSIFGILPVTGQFFNKNQLTNLN